MNDFDDFLKKKNEEMATKSQKQDAAAIESARKSAIERGLIPPQWSLLLSSVRALTEGKSLGQDSICWSTEGSAYAGNVSLSLRKLFKRDSGDYYTVEMSHGNPSDSKREMHLTPLLEVSIILSGQLTVGT